MNKVVKKSLLSLAVITAFAPAAQALEAGDIIGRAGVAHVDPAGKSGDTLEVEADSNTQLGLTMSYMLSSNLAIGVLAATPFKHTISTDGVDVIETKQLPPTVTLQYHFDASETIKPYVGAGLNYTVFFDEKATSELKGLIPNAKVELDDSFGLALEAGADIDLGNDWYANAAVWYIDIETEAKVKQSGATALEVKEVDVDPVALMLGVGKRF